MKLFLVAALITTYVVISEGNKCDPDILAKIKTLQSGKEIKDIIKTLISNGKEVVVATTKGYYPEDTKCIFSVFSTDSITSVRVVKTGCPVITMNYITEGPGILTEPQTKITGYHVHLEGGVTALYKCSEDGPEGDPEGLVKVSESTKDRSVLINKAKEVLDGLGIKLAVTLPSACA